MAANDYFLKLDGIIGESSDSKHKGEIDVLAFSFGESQTGAHAAGGGRAAGKVQMSDFTFTTRTTKASPQLFLHCAQGKHIKQAVLTARKAGKAQQEYIKMKLSDVMISSYTIGGADGDDGPVDTFALNFAKVSFDYFAQKSDGSLEAGTHAGWDLKQNVKI